MHSNTTTGLAGAIARAGALMLIAASAALGTCYAYKLGYHFGAAVAFAFAAMALGGELLKPIAVERAFAAGWRRPLRAVACLAVAIAAIAYSLAAELAFSAGARGDLAAGRKASLNSSRAAGAAARRASDELGRIKPARPVAELEALVAGARPVCRIEVNLQGRREVCSKPPGLLAELGRAKRRAELEATIAAAASSGDAAVGEADPQAAALVAYLAAAGIAADQARVATWLHLLPVLLLEIGSAFGLLVAVGNSRQLPAETATGQPWKLWQRLRQLLSRRRVATVSARLPAPETLATPATVAHVRQKPPRQRSPGDRATVVAALQAAGRPLSNDELAAAMGCHKGEASKRVARLAGVVRKVHVGRHVAISLVH